LRARKRMLFVHTHLVALPRKRQRLTRTARTTILLAFSLGCNTSVSSLWDFLSVHNQSVSNPIWSINDAQLTMYIYG
jgi:hypothetical protein